MPAKKKTTNQAFRKKGAAILAAHYGKLLIVLICVVLYSLIVLSIYLNATAQKEIGLAQELSRQRIANLEFQLYNLKYDSKDQVRPVGPITFQKISDALSWEIQENGARIGQLQGTVPFIPLVIKEYENKHYIGIYRDVPEALFPFKLFELDRRGYELTELFESPVDQLNPVYILDVSPQTKQVALFSNNSVLQYSYETKQTTTLLDLSSYLGKEYVVSAARYNDDGTLLGISLSKIAGTKALHESLLYELSVGTGNVREIDAFPKNKNCVITAFEKSPRWICAY